MELLTGDRLKTFVVADGGSQIESVAVGGSKFSRRLVSTIAAVQLRN